MRDAKGKEKLIRLLHGRAVLPFSPRQGIGHIKETLINAWIARDERMNADRFNILKASIFLISVSSASDCFVLNSAPDGIDQGNNPLSLGIDPPEKHRNSARNERNAHRAAE